MGLIIRVIITELNHLNTELVSDFHRYERLHRLQPPTLVYRKFREDAITTYQMFHGNMHQSLQLTRSTIVH